MTESWCDIEGYEGCYQISNLGRVRSVDRTVKGNKCIFAFKGKILSPKTHRAGYLVVCLCKNRKQKMYYIHRLVAEAFIPNPDSLPQVNHKDENKTNNRLDNLEWCSAKYNTNYATANERRIKTLKQNPNFLKNVEKSKIRNCKKIKCIETNEIFNSTKELSNILSVNIQRIRHCCRRFTKSSINNLHYKYV